MAEQRSHFTHRGQACGCLQTLLAGARNFFYPTLGADVEHRNFLDRHFDGLFAGGAVLVAVNTDTGQAVRIVNVGDG